MPPKKGRHGMIIIIQLYLLNLKKKIQKRFKISFLTNVKTHCFVVFFSDKSGSASATIGKQQPVKQDSKQQNKPDDVKKSIFGNWTGKTPVTLLNEYCQKQHWQKPEYQMVHICIHFD